MALLACADFVLKDSQDRSELSSRQSCSLFSFFSITIFFCWYTDPDLPCLSICRYFFSSSSSSPTLEKSFMVAHTHIHTHRHTLSLSVSLSSLSSLSLSPLPRSVSLGHVTSLSLSFSLVALSSHLVLSAMKSYIQCANYDLLVPVLPCQNMLRLRLALSCSPFAS